MNFKKILFLSLSLRVMIAYAYADDPDSSEKMIDIAHHCKNDDDMIEIKPGEFERCVKKIVFDMKTGYVIENELRLYSDEYEAFPIFIDATLFRGGYFGKIVGTSRPAYVMNEGNDYGIQTIYRGVLQSLGETVSRLGAYRYLAQEPPSLFLSGETSFLLPKNPQVPQDPPPPVNPLPVLGETHWKIILSQLQNVKNTFSFKTRNELLQYGKLKMYVEQSCQDEKNYSCKEALYEISKISQKFFINGVLRKDGKELYLFKDNDSKSKYNKQIANIIISDSRYHQRLLIVPLLINTYIPEQNDLVYFGFMKTLETRGEEEAFRYILRKSSKNDSFKYLKNIYSSHKDIALKNIENLCFSFMPNVKNECVNGMRGVL